MPSYEGNDKCADNTQKIARYILYIIGKENGESKNEKLQRIQTIHQRIGCDKGGIQMAVVKEIRDGPCTIIIHDDAVVQTSEERQKIIDNVSRIVIRALRSKEEPA